MKNTLIREMKKITGPEHVQTAIEDRICYAFDATVQSSSVPDLVVHPGSRDEVVSIVRVASGAGVPLVPRGAGTGLSGGAIARNGGIVLHFDRMSRIKELDRKNMMAVIEPGVINWDLKEAAGDAGLFYPPDPGSSRFCTLGGNVGENAGGPNSARYGVTGDYVLSLEAVLASGEIIRAGSQARRDVAGYDLVSLLVGSEGTLAVITEITLRLLPRRRARAAAFIAFKDFILAAEAAEGILAAGLDVAALELMDRTTLECLDKFVPGKLPIAGAMLLLELDGDPDSLEARMAGAVSLVSPVGGELVASATGKDCEDLWELRRAISPSLGHAAISKIGEDISIPVGLIGAMYERIQDISSRNDLEIAVFGHAGDGNLHPNILTDRRDAEMMRRTGEAIKELFRAAVELGGSISGEHGIGITKSPFMQSVRDAASLRVMREIKGLFDPDNILNPGKIFPES